ncbi:WASH complex subunit 2 [Nymphon striatum]|nr:WASH complex subunit 2 [Nymphon striatum]
MFGGIQRPTKNGTSYYLHSDKFMFTFYCFLQQDNEKKMDNKMKTLILGQRVEVIKKLNNGHLCRSIATEYGCGRTQISKIKLERDEIMKECESGGRSNILSFLSLMGNSDTDKSGWERPWNMDEVRKNGSNWTLAGDSGLLNYLQAFSQKMVSETHGIEKELSKLIQDSKNTKPTTVSDGSICESFSQTSSIFDLFSGLLVIDVTHILPCSCCYTHPKHNDVAYLSEYCNENTDRLNDSGEDESDDEENNRASTCQCTTIMQLLLLIYLCYFLPSSESIDLSVFSSSNTNSRLNNAVNDFLNLSNTQFVENRVYEEDIEVVNEDSKKSEPEKTKQEKEAELIPKISSALHLGLSVIDSDFIKLELDPNDSDSDDEDSPISGDSLLEPKDPYINRNLPVLIGSVAFMEDEFVGLQDEASEGSRTPTRVPHPHKGPAPPQGSRTPTRVPHPHKGPAPPQGSRTPTRVPHPHKGPAPPQGSRTPTRVPHPHKGPAPPQGSRTLYQANPDDESEIKSDVGSSDSSKEKDEEQEETYEMSSLIKIFKSHGPLLKFLETEGHANKTWKFKLSIEDESWDDTDGSDIFNSSKEENDVDSDDSSDKSDDSDYEKKTANVHHEVDEVDEPSEVISPKIDFNAELSKKLGLPANKQEANNEEVTQNKRRSSTTKSTSSKKSKDKKHSSKPRTSSIRSKASTTHTAEEEGDMFSVSVEEDEFSPFSKKGGLFSGGGNLFEDIDEGGLFGDEGKKDSPKYEKANIIAEKEEVKKAVKKELKKGEKKRSPSKSSVTKTKAKKPDSLFEEDDDDDLFGSSKPRKKSTSKTKSDSFRSRQNTTSSNLFSEENDDDDEDASEIHVQPKKPEKQNDSDQWEKGSTISKKSQHRTVSMRKESVAKPGAEADKSKVDALSHDDLFANKPKSNNLFSNTEPVTEKKVKSKAKISNTKTTGSSSLFSEDDSDLFSSSSKSKGTPKEIQKETKTSQKPKPTSLFDNEDDLFFVAAKPKESGKNKQAISLFDGDTLFSPSENEDSLPVVSEPKKSSDVVDKGKSTTKQRTNTALSLFDYDDDEEGDGESLFSSATKSSAPATTPKQHIIYMVYHFDFTSQSLRDCACFKVKMASNGTMILALSLLYRSFAGTRYINYADNVPEKSSPTGTPRTHQMWLQGSASQMLFEDEDVLFKGPEPESPDVDLFSEKVHRKKRDRPPSILNEGFESSTEETKKVQLKSPDEMTQNQENDEPVEAVSKPKKLAGAVSMFGGFDPLAAKKALASRSPKQQSPVKEATSCSSDVPDKAAGDSKSPETSSKTDAEDLLFHSATKPAKSPAKEISSPVSTKSPIKLNIDPSALLPGAKPPVKEFKEPAINFEDPPEAKTLHNVVKERAKAGVKRRPPTRKGRKATSRMSSIEVTPSLGESLSSDVASKSEPPTPSKVPQDTLFHPEPPPDLDFTDSKSTLITSHLPDDIFSPETEEEDLFAVASVQSEIGSIDNNFGKSDSNIFSVTKDNVVTKNDDDDYDDNFATPVPKKTIEPKSGLQAPSVTKSSKNTKSIFDSDDIFDVPSTKSSQKVSSKVVDDDDIFADTKPSSSANKSKTTKSIFDNQEDDIFSDLGPSKVKSKATSKSNSNSLFDDDGDSDIFAVVPSSKPSSTKSRTSSKPKPVKPIVQTEDIFDDPLMSNLK